MSARLDSLLDATRLADIAKHEAANAQPLTAFRVTIKNSSREVSSFEAMGYDSLAVAEQHAGLCAPGEYVQVMTLERWRKKLAEQFAGPLGEEFYRRADASEPTAAQKADREFAEAMRIQLRMNDISDVIGRR
jgi:hypothetical protein